MRFTPLVLGSGGAGRAILKSCSAASVADPELRFNEGVTVPRGTPLAEIARAHENPILFIANPHALHAPALVEAAATNAFAALFTEKPACVNAEQLRAIAALREPVSVFHVYRQTWGVQTIRERVASGECGRIVSIEGRYWQSSSAERALAASSGDAAKKGGWKNDESLSGPYDVYLDLGTHWVDAASFIAGGAPIAIRGRRSNAGAEAPHRDSHVNLALDFASGAWGSASVSKFVHGATNAFEITVIGERASLTWEFLRPDEILVGNGRDRGVITRKDSSRGSGQPGFHGMGWVEGYIEIIRETLRAKRDGRPSKSPTLHDHLPVLEAMLGIAWR